MNRELEAVGYHTPEELHFAMIFDDFFHLSSFFTVFLKKKVFHVLYTTQERAPAG